MGLKKEDKIKLDFKKNNSKKLFYDVIYNPEKTNFLLEAEKSETVHKPGEGISQLDKFDAFETDFCNNHYKNYKWYEK